MKRYNPVSLKKALLFAVFLFSVSRLQAAHIINNTNCEWLVEVYCFPKGNCDLLPVAGQSPCPGCAMLAPSYTILVSPHNSYFFPPTDPCPPDPDNPAMPALDFAYRIKVNNPNCYIWYGYFGTASCLQQFNNYSNEPSCPCDVNAGIQILNNGEGGIQIDP